MSPTTHAVPRRRRPVSVFRDMLVSEAGGGLVLMASAALALAVANSPLADTYFAALKAHLGPLSVLHWINDALMAVFFLLVGLEIKREVLDGRLRTWPDRILPGLAALGGMAAPAIVYAAVNWNSPETLRGWAIPAATDIAFALGVLALLGSRVPVSLKIFLTALAIIDDLGAVLIIALFYTADLSLPMLAGAAATLAMLYGMNKAGVARLWPYLILGIVLWVFVLASASTRRSPACCSPSPSRCASVSASRTIRLRRCTSWSTRSIPGRPISSCQSSASPMRACRLRGSRRACSSTR